MRDSINLLLCGGEWESREWSPEKINIWARFALEQNATCLPINAVMQTNHKGKVLFAIAVSSIMLDYNTNRKQGEQRELIDTLQMYLLYYAASVSMVYWKK